MPVAEVRPLAEVAFDEAEWSGLATRAIEPNVFGEGWFLKAARHLPQAAEARLVTVRQGGRLIAALPVCRRQGYGRLPLEHVQTWLHYHSFLGTPLLHRDAAVAGWTGLIAALDASGWARGLIHLTGLRENGPAHRALIDAAGASGRPVATVHRIERAMLASDLSPAAYYETHVRKKKRKELKRLESRLAELAPVSVRRFGPGDNRDEWAEAYLALEARGWKGAAGSALGTAAGTRAFFLEALAGAEAAGRLDMIRMDLDGRAIAMLVNLLAPPGGFAFKTAFDEDHARFSPGVLLQIANLDLLERPGLDWVDSCAVENHSMIDSLWAERQPIVRVTLPLAGARGLGTFALARAAERAAAAVRQLRRKDPPA